MNHGIVLVKKEKGLTSYDVIRILKKTFKTKKVGHAGTLDPFATGLLIVGINEGTKLLPLIESQTKEYIAELTFGELKDSYDITGKTIKRKKIKTHSYSEVDKVLHSFVGDYLMTPPIYSAIKVNGKASYKYARKNESIKLKERLQHIYDVRLIVNEKEKIIFYVKCDKGTYIRSLGVDIANRLNEFGYLSNLERISIGNFKIANVKFAKDIKESNIIPIKDALKIKSVEIKDINKIKNGNPLKIKSKEKLVFITNKNVVYAIYEYNDIDKLYYSRRGFYYGNL